MNSELEIAAHSASLRAGTVLAMTYRFFFVVLRVLRGKIFFRILLTYRGNVCIIYNKLEYRKQNTGYRRKQRGAGSVERIE